MANDANVIASTSIPFILRYIYQAFWTVFHTDFKNQLYRNTTTHTDPTKYYRSHMRRQFEK